MNKSYSLGLSGWRPNSLGEATSSNDMIFAELENGFKQLNHVDLHILPVTWGAMEKNSDIYFNVLPELDFLLLHIYNGYSVIQNIEKARNKIKYQICSFIEHPQEKMDFTFGYLKNFEPNCYIPFPYSKEFMINKPKIPKTILLESPHLLNGIPMLKWDISEKLIMWLKPLIEENYRIYQLTTKKSIVDFVEPIIICNYEKYMESTSQIETFIQSHVGSYEHSIIDMVGRGIRTLIPENQLKNHTSTFIPTEIVYNLQLPVFTTQEEFLNIIRTPVDIDLWNSKINKMTEMKEVIKIIDNHFQEVLDKNDK